MPINVFDNSSNNSENDTDNSFFVRKPYIKSTILKLILKNT